MDGKLPAPESPDVIWEEDRLERRKHAEFLATFLPRVSEKRAKKGEAYVLNLDARWGEGKTFFMTRFARHLRHGGATVVEINAWTSDHADDPMIAIMSELDEQMAQSDAVRKTWKTVSETGAKVLAAVARGAALHVLSTLISRELAEDVAKGVDKVASDGVEALLTKDDDAVRNFRSEESAAAMFREELAGFASKLSMEKGVYRPLYVLIDELDRCRPDYALRLLERVKHLFAVPNIVFVIATDLEQVGHATTAVYGAGFDGRRYLSRFFDRRYIFEKPSHEALIASSFRELDIDARKIFVPFEISPERFLSGATHAFNVDLRSCRRIVEILEASTLTWSRPHRLALVFLAPLIIAYVTGDEPLFDALRSGRLEPVKRLLTERSIMWRLGEGWSGANGTAGGNPIFQEAFSHISEIMKERQAVQRSRGPDIKPTPIQLHIWEVARSELRDSHLPDLREREPSYLIEYGDLVASAGRLTELTSTTPPALPDR